MRDVELIIEVHSPDDLKILKNQERTYRTVLDIDLYCDTVDLSYLEEFESLRVVRIRVKKDLEEISVDCTPLFKQMKLEQINVRCDPSIQPPKYTFILEPLALLHHMEVDLLSVSGHPWSFTDSSPRSIKWMVEAYGWSIFSTILDIIQSPEKIEEFRGHYWYDWYRQRYEVWQREVSQRDDVDSDFVHHIYRSMEFDEDIIALSTLSPPLVEVIIDVILHSEYIESIKDNYDTGKEILENEMRCLIEDNLEHTMSCSFPDTSKYNLELLSKIPFTQRFVPGMLKKRREDIMDSTVWDTIHRSSENGLVDIWLLWKTYYGRLVLEHMGVERGVRIREREIKEIRSRINALMSEQEEYFAPLIPSSDIVDISEKAQKAERKRQWREVSEETKKLYSLALDFELKGKLEEALEKYNEVLAAFPNFEGAVNGQARVFRAMDKGKSRQTEFDDNLWGREKGNLEQNNRFSFKQKEPKIQVDFRFLLMFIYFLF